MDAEEFRKQYPDMFEHPELGANEVYLGDFLVDTLRVNLHIYKSNGLPSARPGKIAKMGALKEMPGRKFAFYAIFANLDEVLRTYQAEQAQS